MATITVNSVTLTLCVFVTLLGYVNTQNPTTSSLVLHSAPSVANNQNAVYTCSSEGTGNDPTIQWVLKRTNTSTGVTTVVLSNSQLSSQVVGGTSNSQDGVIFSSVTLFIQSAYTCTTCGTVYRLFCEAHDQGNTAFNPTLSIYTSIQATSAKNGSLCNGELPDAEFGEVTVSPELYHNDVTIGNKINHKPYFKLRCGFKSKPEIKYYVDWYVNGVKNESYGPEYKDALDKLTLNESEIERLGIEVCCAVSASTAACLQRTVWTYSTSFYVGIKILTPVITMPKGTRATIEMKTTVPIGCNYDDSDTSTCTAPVTIFDPTTPGYACDQGKLANIITKSDHLHCSKGIKTLSVGQQLDPDEIFKFEIATIDQNYDDKTTFTLKLEFGSNTGHQKWKNFTFPDIPVLINDTTSYKKKICYSHIDPHMRSSDQYYYENQVEGEYMLYQNIKYKIEVQEKTASCNYHRALCTCAIAIRAGKDVFTINRCGKINYLGFTRCGDRGILQVVRKNDNLYEVFTPIGTKITIKLHTGHSYGGFMSIDITMAPKDKNNVQGLCGYFDGNRNNDFRHRGNTTTSLSGFVKSWELQDTENLFRSPNRSLESWVEQNGLYCTCTEVGTKHVATCAPTQYLNCTKPSSITQVKCRIIGRRKRNAEHNNVKEMNRLFGLMNSGFKHRIVKRQDSENITAEEASALCTNMINGSLAIRNYGEVGGDEDPDAVIEQCTFDVYVGNDESWANSHVEAVNTIVKSMMEYEPTYVANNTEKVDTFLVNTCPGNCSDNGNCTTSGECSCKTYFHGATCSIDERDALVIDDIEGGGVCDLAEGDECVCFTIRSDNILGGYECKMQTTLYSKNGTNHQTPTSNEKGEYEDIFTGVCCDNNYVRSDIEFGLVYEVSISNNGDVFSNIATVHVLNSACQEIDADAQTPFRLKNQTCFIDGVCYLDGDWSYKQTNTCFSCQSSVESYDWTEQPCPTTTVSTTTTSTMSSMTPSVTSTIKTSTSNPTSTLTTTKANTDTSSAPSSTSKSTTEHETSVTSTIKTSTSTPTSTSTTSEANTDTSSAPSSTSKSTTEHETSVTSTIKTSTSTPTSTSTTTEANTDTSSAPSSTSKSTTEHPTPVTSTIKTSTSTPTSTSTTTEAKTDTSSAPSSRSKSTTERETSVTSTIKTSTSTPTSTLTTTEASTDTPSAASTTSTSATEHKTSVTSTINKSTSIPTATSTTREANTDTSSGASTSTPSTSTIEHETSAPEAHTFTVGMIIGVSAGVLVLVVVIVAIVNMTMIIRSKNIKRSAVKRKQLGHIATRYTGRYLDREHTYYC